MPTLLTEAHPTKCLGSLVAVNQKGAQAATQESLDAISDLVRVTF